MLLFEGISIFQTINQFDNEEEYCKSLLSLNEQVSWLLRIKDDCLQKHLQSHSVSQSLSLFILSALHLLSQHGKKLEGMEEWRREYIQMMECELVHRSLRVAARILQLNAPPLLRLIDLPKWFSIFEKLFINAHLTENDVHIVSFVFQECFRRNTLFKKNMEVIIAHFGNNKGSTLNLSYSQLLTLSTALSSWRVVSQSLTEDAKSLLIKLVQSIYLLSDPSQMMAVLRVIHLGFQELETVSFCDDIAKSIEGNSNDMMSDILKQSGLHILAQSLARKAATADNIALLQASFAENLTIEEARDLLSSSNGDVSTALAKAKATFNSDKNRTNRLLDDKSFVIANMQKYRNALLEEDLYEDEYVDSYDSVEAPLSIQSIKSADSLSGLDDNMIKEYIKNPKLFGRSADIRRSKERNALLERMKMSHEQLEGWAILFERNPRKQAILADYSLLHPQNT